jgi:orotidine-5'-phosphate decarboxylase
MSGLSGGGEPFGVRLTRALAARGPLCVGIDAHPRLLERWGLPDTPAGLAGFCDTVVEALADEVAVLKPQSAFFERFGSAGIGVLESTIRQLRERGALVLLDVKRGDIGSTALAYGQAYLEPGRPLYVDAVTVSPYLGVGSIVPVIDLAHEHGGGVFVLARTSNPEGAQVQAATAPDGRSVAQTVIDEVAEHNAAAATPDANGPTLGSVGVVIGATAGGAGLDLSRLGGPVLAPGLGAQGATAADLVRIFGGRGGVVLPVYAREILASGPDISGIRQAADRARQQCDKVLNYPDL